MFAFSGLEPSKGYRCFIKECDNSTDAKYSDIDPSWIHPYDSEADDYDYCTQFAPRPGVTPGACTKDDFDNGTVLMLDDCSNIMYGDFEFTRTFVTDNDLICDKQFQVALVGSIYMSGLFFGSALFGTLGDKYGRKISLMVAIFIGTVASLAGAFAGGSYAGYAVTRFFTAIGK